MSKPPVKFNSLLPLLLLGILITGCNKTQQLKANISNDKLVFVLAKQSKNEVFSIQDFTVLRMQCETDCIMWSIVNKIDKNGEPTFAIIQQNSISYGEALVDLKTKNGPKEMVSGHYSAGGTAIFIGNTGNIKEPRKVSADFTIDGSGKILKLE